ncbi:MAG: hypothetical protein ACRCZB_05345 [Bacteroidales bacterium]
MLTLDCTSIKKYSKICDRLKDTNQPIFDSIRLDFENERAIFGSQRGFGSIKMPVTGYDGSQKPFSVNLTAFLAIISEFPILDLDGFTFKQGTENEFEIAHLEDTINFPSFEIKTAKSFSCTKEIIASIKRAGVFTEQDGTPSLNGVFIFDNIIASTDKSRLYEDKRKELDGISLSLPKSVWEVLALEVLGENLTIDDSSDNSFIISNGDDISVVFSTNNDLKLPPIRTPEFINLYNHSSYVEVKKDSFLQIVNFMAPFVQNSASGRMQLILSDSELELKTEDNGQRVFRKIAVDHATEEFSKPILKTEGTAKVSTDEDPKVSTEGTPEVSTEGTTKGSFYKKVFWVSNQWIKTIINSLQGATIVIQVDPAKPAINFSTKENPSTHIVYSKLRGEEKW